jgi:hypothetical protein
MVFVAPNAKQNGFAGMEMMGIWDVYLQAIL